VESDLVSGPALFGILRPCLVIPNLRALAQSPDQLHHIFLHELAHVKRNDVAANVVMQMLLAIHWFNPLIWYAYYRMRDDQELACDALALSRLQPDETKAYGKTLIDLFEQASSSVGMAGVASLTGSMSQIRRRMVLIRTFRPSSLGRSLLGALVFAAFCVFVFIAGKSTVTGERIMYIGGGDISKQHAFQIGKVNGEWKVKFITDSGQTDRTMAGATGILIVPETGYHSTPGTRDLIFQKGPHDKEWKLISIQER
jgi:hypothetical protein